MIGETKFFSSHELKIFKRTDYTILADREVTFLPNQIKPILLTMMNYFVSDNIGQNKLVVKETLNKRVLGGQILAYRYDFFNINNKNVTLYGIVSSIGNKFGVGEKSYAQYLDAPINCPREMFVALKFCKLCIFHKNCNVWRFLDRNNVLQEACSTLFSLQNTLIMLGDVINIPLDRVSRNCSTCAKCIDCSIMVERCKTHKVCKHKMKKSNNRDQNLLHAITISNTNNITLYNGYQ